jgi:hypothetical protein
MRRFVLGSLAGAAAVAAVAAAPPAFAHHGDTGDYLRAAPVLVIGTVLEVESGFPHAQVTVQSVGNATTEAIPASFTALNDQEGTDVLSRLAQATGNVQLVFDPIVTGELSALPPLQQGDEVVAVAYPRCPQGGEYDNEFRVQAMLLPNGTTLFRRDDSVVDYVDECADANPTIATTPLPSAQEDRSQSTPSASEGPEAKAAPTQVAEGETAESGLASSPIIVALLSAAALVVIAVLIAAVRLRRTGG